MPAAAVIPAPIAYIKVVAVKKLVVRAQFRTGRGGHLTVPFLRQAPNLGPRLRGGRTPVLAGVLLTECPARPASAP